MQEQTWEENKQKIHQELQKMLPLCILAVQVCKYVTIHVLHLL